MSDVTLGGGVGDVAVGCLGSAYMCMVLLHMHWSGPSLGCRGKEVEVRKKELGM